MFSSSTSIISFFIHSISFILIPNIDRWLGTINVFQQTPFGWLFEFYGISTFVGYLTPNPFLCKLSVLFQTIQFSMIIEFKCQKDFYSKLFSLFKQF